MVSGELGCISMDCSRPFRSPKVWARVWSFQVAGLDWEGRGFVRLLVREWKQVFSFSFFRTLPGEKVTLRVDQIKRRDTGRKLEIASLGTTSPGTDSSMKTHYAERSLVFPGAVQCPGAPFDRFFG